ncbi:hypothetical protein IPA_05030 [Ignicoccus pacificus DSM 13166]|uniref:Phosphoribosyltransferase domain-containing protein n=1 Tax=Ignicoccus pacificus DSM 13166 TaxID=940294 RepID=A0A977KB76_9CREN|nr:hypothetical protein IPA_05030 [Ignicoccus pacificus DSM 13166]
MEFELIDWKKVHKFTLDLSKKVKDEDFDIIVGVLRGGIVPAILLSDILSKDVVAVRVKSYQGTHKLGQPRILTPLCDLLEKKVLIVDDVCDTGETITILESYLKMLGAKEVKKAVIVKKSKCRAKIDHWVIESDAWILFPWEVVELIKKGEESVKELLPRLLGEDVSNALLGKG